MYVPDLVSEHQKSQFMCFILKMSYSLFFYSNVLLQQCFLAILFHSLRTSLAKTISWLWLYVNFSYLIGQVLPLKYNC